MLRVLSLCVCLFGPAAFGQTSSAKAQPTCDCAGGKCDACKKDVDGKCACGRACQVKACSCGEEPCACKKCECAGGTTCNHRR